ncbi:type II toxin-antitoxin system Phd/YefM family antitoxin [Rheinheimera baltica]|uniref:type II toxin-antitoxin system Phd/YefM family antitoxin n=1 Tax=Rheinheimera baltica TaxID=67576 RepID=UPI00273F5DEC|nr:type II toxin-antitoxin system Phd/YefM family antitoxin [Rheinheimera baltica]MDP5150449.1 type II toxin-antitoxin system Phd/YefM family antitoxin [Rheinheimera baltica]
MNILTVSEARANFKAVIDTVLDTHEPTVVTNQRSGNVVMISQEDYNAMQETLYLLSTPKNANRLRESVARIKAGAFEVKEPFLDEQETN